MATEKRLISLDEALEATHKEVWWTKSEQAAIRSFLVKLPRVDAVEVVRCKDCNKWYRHTMVDRERGDCRRYQTTKHESGFCDKGERRSDD